MPDDGHGNAVAELTNLIADLQRGDPRTREGLRELLVNALRHIPGAQYAGMTEIGHDQAITTAAATNRFARLLDNIQQRHREGPCVSAAWKHHTVHIDDMESDDRWPRYRQDALAQTPIRSVLAFEVFVDDDVVGALNFYSEQPGVFGEESIELGLIFAAHIALAWNMFRRSEQFRSALASRDIIGQAKGMIMARFHVDSVRAFELLKRLSQDSNVKLVDVAQSVIDTGRL
jgi:GAF domain-containing protein